MDDLSLTGLWFLYGHDHNMGISFIQVGISGFRCRPIPSRILCTGRWPGIMAFIYTGCAGDRARQAVSGGEWFMTHERKRHKSRRDRLQPACHAVPANRPGTPDPGESGPPAGGRLRWWVFRLLAVTVIPAVVLAGLEGGLRVAGYGYSTRVFLPCRVAEQAAYGPNRRFAWQFFPRDMARDFSPFVFSAQKPSQTFRIFVLGASAAQGVPEPAFGWGRVLKVLLSRTYPQWHFEVIPLAMPAINSHAVLNMARACLRHEPDLLIVYLGNNEVVGPYGAGTVFTPLLSHRSLVRASLWLKGLRLGQLMSDAAYRLSGRVGTPSRWRGMEMFLGHQVDARDPALQHVYRHFRANLADIRELAVRQGVPVLFSTVAVNLKDCPPFASQHNNDISDDALAAWTRCQEQGRQHETAGDFPAAVHAYEEAVRHDPDYAETHYRLGRCYEGTQQFGLAAQAYARACELDTLRFRADQEINTIIRDTAWGREEQGIYLVDAAETVKQASLHRIPGDQWFYEHVHFNFAGNYLMARTLLDSVEAILPAPVRDTRVRDTAVPTKEACAACLGYTLLDQYQIAQRVMDGIITKPPFMNQAYHTQSVQRWEGVLANLNDQVTQQPFDVFLKAYARALQESPNDWYLHYRYASLLASEQVNDQAAALRHYRFVQQCLPQWPAPYVYMGLAALKLGLLKQGIEYTEQAIALDDSQFEAHFNLGLACQMQHKTAEAIAHYHRTLQYYPAHARAYLNLGVLLFNQGNTEDAIETYLTGQEQVPDYPELYYNLGVIYEKNGRANDAIEQYQQAQALLPDSVKYQQALDRARSR